MKLQLLGFSLIGVTLLQGCRGNFDLDEWPDPIPPADAGVPDAEAPPPPDTKEDSGARPDSGTPDNRCVLGRSQLPCVLGE